METEKFCKLVVKEILKKNIQTRKEILSLRDKLAKEHKPTKFPSLVEILINAPENKISKLKKVLMTKPTRSISGIAPIAVMTKPIPCPHGRCIYCPGGPKSRYGDVPQSYTGGEPATMRGIRNHFDAYLQIFNRLEQYVLLGHNFDKVELIVMGGTFPSFPLDYQEEFIKYSFKAMNDFSKLFFKKDGDFNYKKFKEFYELPTDNFEDKERTKRIHKKLLELIAKEKKYTFISTGMSTMKNIENAIKIFKKYKCPFELMHCHSAYPMPTEEANLSMISTLKKKFKCKVGYSGHEIGATNVSIPAVMLGASSIERHITLNRTWYGHDQAASLEPQGIRRLVRDIRIIEKIQGNGKKKIWPAEIPNQKKLRQIFC